MKTIRLTRSSRLPKRIWYCIVVSSLFAAGRREEAARVLKRGLEEDRVPEKMFSELFLHLSLILGYPSMLDGLSRLRDLRAQSHQLKERVKATSDQQAQGLKVLKRIHGRATTRLLTNLRMLHEDIPALIVEGAYGGIIGRSGLTLREREIVNVAVLAIQRLHSQLYSHLRGAIRIGVNWKTLADVIRLATRISGTEQSYALSLLSTIQQN